VIAGQIDSITAQSSYAKPLSSSSILVATWERSAWDLTSTSHIPTARTAWPQKNRATLSVRYPGNLLIMNSEDDDLDRQFP